MSEQTDGEQTKAPDNTPEYSEVDRTFRDLEGNKYVVPNDFYHWTLLPNTDNGRMQPRRLAGYHAGSELENHTRITGNKCIVGYINYIGTFMHVLSVNAEGKFAFVGGSAHIFPDGTCSIS